MSISSTASTSTTTFYPTSNRTSIDTTATSINNDYVNTNKPIRLSTTSSLFTIDSELNDLYPELPSNFKLIELLGEGAFSSVYKAIDISKNNMIVAIKIINKINLNSKQLQNIINEINILKQINYHHHPNIIELLGVIDGINQTFLILEYCDGGEIFDQILKYTYLSEPLSYHVFKQILNALQYLHNTLNIVHRDLKPENLLFNKIPFFKRGINDNNLEKYLRKSDDINEKIDEGEFKYGIGGGTIGVIKLADFGLAKQLNDKNIAQTPCGTTGYTAPEVFQCRNNNNNNNNNNKEKNNSNPLESSPKNYKQFVPYYTNSLSTIYHLTKINRIVNKIINNFGNFVGTIGNISQYSETNKVMKSLKNSSTKINQKILEAICATWVNDCSQFYELEDWTLDKQNNKYNNNNNNKKNNNNNNSGNAKCTKLMNVIQCYQLYVLLKISNLVIHDQSSDYNVVAVYPSKRMLVSIEIQFMRSLNIIVDSMMKKYNLDRQISQQSSNNMDDSNAKNLQVFKILTMNNFDKLSRIIYPELLLQFDKFFDKDLSKQNLKLFADIDKASLTIIDDILNIEKLYIAQTVNKFFHTTTGAKAKAKGTNISYTSPQVLKVDGFVYEILIHFVKLINKIKPLTNEEVFVTIINELQLNLLKNILDNTRQILLKSSLAYVNLKLDANFILLVFEKSKLLQLNDSSYKILQILLNEIDNKNNELFNDKNQQFNYSKKDFDEILQLNMQDSANEFSCF